MVGGDRRAVGRLGDACMSEEFVPVLGGTGSATADGGRTPASGYAVAVPEAQGEVGGIRALPDERPWQGYGLERLVVRKSSFA